MKQVTSSLFILTFLVSLTVNVGAQRRRRLRLCRENISTIQTENVTIQYETILDESGQNDTLLLKILITWDVANPLDLPFDGFLVKVMQHSDIMKTFLPINQCISGPQALWVNSSDCPSSGFPICPSGVSSMLEASCLCPADNCSLWKQPLPCRGSPYYLTAEGGLHVALQNTVRNYSIYGEFHTNYQVHVYPYYRENVNPLQTTKAFSADDCHEITMNSQNVTLAQAIALCCETEIPHFKPLFLTVTEIRPIFTEGTAEVFLFWMPPVFQENVSFTARVFSHVLISEDMAPIIKDIRVVSVEEIPPQLRVPCYNGTYGYAVIIKNVQISYKYTITVFPRYAEPISTRYCRFFGACAASLTLDFPDTTNLCEPTFNPCGRDEVCRRVGDSSNVTYSCELRCRALTFSHQMPLNIQMPSIVPNFTAQTATVTLSWLPPVQQTGDLTFTMITSTIDDQSVDESSPWIFRQGPIAKQQTAALPSQFDVPCYNSSYTYQVSVFEVPITGSFRFSIQSQYHEPLQQRYCNADDASCSDFIVLNFQDVYYCEDRYNPCEDGQRCSRNNYTYMCSSSYRLQSFSFGIFLMLEGLFISSEFY